MSPKLRRDASDNSVAPHGRPGRKIVVASDAARLGREHLRILEDHGFELFERYDLIGSKDENALVDALVGAWGFVAGGQRISRGVIDRSPTLRVVARTGAGYDGIDMDAATSAGVAVLITPAHNAESVADLTLALMLTTLRQIVMLDRMTRSGRWRQDVLPAPDLHHATVGIVGLGNIGRAVARRLSGFQCRVLASDPVPDTEFCKQWNITTISLGEMLPQVDVLTVHTPLSSSTHHLIGEEAFALLPERAILINTSRGGTVDEAALVSAVESGRLAGAGVDVFESEPLPGNHPLGRLPNVVLTPHVASYSKTAVPLVVNAVAKGLLDFAAGRVPTGAVYGSSSNNINNTGDIAL